MSQIMRTGLLITTVFFGLLTPLLADTLAQRIGFPQVTWDRLMDQQGILQKKLHRQTLTHWQGSHFEIGKQQARYMLQHRNPMYQEILFDLVDQKATFAQVLALLPNPLDSGEAQRFHEMLGRWLPNQRQELAGFSAELNIPLIQLIQIIGSLSTESGCTAIGLAPAKTNNGHVVVGYSHDFHSALNDQLTIIRKPNHGFSTFGNSVMLLGLMDGVNEKGVFIASTLVIARPRQDALFFAFVVRHALENASTAAEAVQIITALPGRDSYNYLIADPQGDMAVVEKRWDQWAVRRPGLNEGGIYATNHFQSQSMETKNTQLMPNSVVRFDRITEFLRQNPKLSAKKLGGLMDKPYEEGGIKLEYYEPLILGNLYSYQMDLNQLKLNLSIAGNPRTTSLDLKQWFTDTPLTDGLGQVLQLKGEMNNRQPNLEAFGDLDWWATPGQEGLKFFSLVGGSVNPLGLMIENRMSYRHSLNNPVWGPYIEAGLRQVLSPVFHRYGPYLRWASKSWVDLEVGSEQVDYFSGLDQAAKLERNQHSTIEERLKNKETVSFQSPNLRFTAHLHHSLGPVILVDHFDTYRWSSPPKIKRFYNFETGLSQNFGDEARNNLIALVPIGAPDWAVGLFHQENHLIHEPGWLKTTGVQLHFLKTNGADEGLIRLGHQTHSPDQPDAPQGVNLSLLWKHQWLGL